MKQTIKEELETKYLKEELVNDNTLLLYEKNEDEVLVKMRYIEFNRIKEIQITTLSFEEYIEGNRIRFNDDNTALAVFKKEKDKEVLKTFYDLVTHSTYGSHLMSFGYNEKFSEKVDVDLLVLKK